MMASLVEALDYHSIAANGVIIFKV